MPRNVLFATDLSVRCERALGRAAALCTDWGSRFMVLHVLAPAGGAPDPVQLSPWSAPDPRELALRTLLLDVGSVTPKASLLVGDGEVSEVISQTVAAESCDLVVLGMSRDGLLGRILLERTTDRVLRQVKVPVLIVKDRPRKPYRNIVVATDLSSISHQAVEAAALMFPEGKLTILHAYVATTSRLGSRELTRRECEDLLSRTGMAHVGLPPKVVVEEGCPMLLLKDYALAMGVDLIVLGIHRRSKIAEIMTGSVAKSIVDDASCDVLIIPQKADCGNRDVPS